MEAWVSGPRVGGQAGGWVGGKEVQPGTGLAGGPPPGILGWGLLAAAAATSILWGRQ